MRTLRSAKKKMLNDFYQHKYIQARNSCFSRFSKNKLIILNSVNDCFCYSFFFPPLWRTKNPLTHGNYYLEAKFPFSSEEFFHPCLNQSWQLCFLRLNSLVTICLVSHPKKKKRERERITMFCWKIQGVFQVHLLVLQ